MPASLAHVLFGQQVLENVPPQSKAYIQKERPYFDLGLQGPDIFFYYEPFHRNAIVRYGNEIHQNPGAKGLQWAYKQIQTPAQQAYWLGWLCHFVLDCYCHPYINQHAPRITDHYRLEAAYDRYCLDKSKNPTIAHQIYQRKQVDATQIARLWENRTAKEVAKSLRHRQRVLWVLNYPKLVKAMESIAGKKGMFSTLCTPKMVAPQDFEQMNYLEMYTNQAAEICRHYMNDIQKNPELKWFESELFWKNYNGAVCNGKVI